MTDLRHGLLAATLATIIAGCSLISGNVPTPAPTDDQTPSPSVSVVTPRPTKKPRPTPTVAPSADAATPKPTKKPRPTVTPTPAATPMPPIEGLADLLGTDGRFTILLLGSDARANLGGERTDTIMVATIDPTNGKVAMVSLPRDTINVPIGPGNDYGPKVTGLFQDFRARTGSRAGAYKKMVNALEYAFGIEIDAYALAGFQSVIHLIDAIGGITVYLDAPLVDPHMHITKRGLVLKKGKNHLDGKRALAFARTRHSDSDYARARRQQIVIATAAQKVLSQGLGALPALATLAGTQIETDIPLSAAPALFELANRARLGNFKSVVLGPTTFSTEDRATYSNVLKIDVVRKLFRRVFAPVGG